MGLLDGLFDPSLYGGGSGGLLDMLRMSQMQGNSPSPLDNAQWPSGPIGAPGGVAQSNQPSPLDTAQWPQGPVGAPATFADRFNALPNAPQPFAPAGRQFDSALFDPSTYAPNQAQPIAVGRNYQMPRMGNADLYAPRATDMSAQSRTPDPTAIPQNAQPTQGQMPQEPADTGGFGGFFRGLAANAHNGPIGAILGGVAGAAGMGQGNQTQRFLVAKGLDPDLARVVTSDPHLLRAVLPNLMGVGGQTDDIKEYQFAKREDPSLTFAKYMAQKKATSGEYSLNPVYGTNAKGEAVILQTGKNAEAIETKLPEGVKVSSGIEKVDLGTHWALYDKKSGVSLGTQPKDLQGKEAAEERGKAQGQAQAALPGALADAEATKNKIDQLLKHEGLNSIVGPLDQYRPTWMLGEKGNDALARYKQLQGQAFLQAYNLLKGGGAITDIEGKKAESAMARLDRAQSEEDFKTALKDFRDAIDAGVTKLRAKAGGAPSQSAAPAPTRIRLNADGTIAQ